MHAPTPTDEPLGVPALLIASLPLDTTRRHAAPGPLTDFLVQRAADAYTELLADWQPGGRRASSRSCPARWARASWTAQLRQAILERLPRTAFLPARARPAATTTRRLPCRAAARPGTRRSSRAPGAETVRVLAEVLPTLLPAGLERRVELRTLGVARVPLTEAVDRLAGLEKAPEWWRRLYDSLAGVDPDRLTGLPVPLADGAYDHRPPPGAAARSAARCRAPAPGPWPGSA